MPRSRFILTLLALGALACGVVAAWWWFDADRQAFYTDDSAIRSSAADAAVRDILWKPPEPLRTVDGQPIVGDDPVVSADGDTLLLTRTSELGDADLFIAGRLGDAWTLPRALVELNTIDNELAPAISADGQRLYFASDRPGGAGGLDVWIALREGERWSSPTPLGFNTRADETDPHPLAGREGVESLLFASDRPRDGEVGQPPLRDFDLYLADLDATDPRHLHELSSPARDTGPAVTPSGDFVYFASDRDGSAGGLDLYRARVRVDASGHAFDPARTLGPSINTAGDDLAPSLSLEGFAIQFARAGGEPPVLMRAVSREVYLARSTTRGSLLGLIPWILLALALVLLLAMLRRVVRDAQWQARIATLGLMAKCALVSLVVHAGIMALLAALQVPPTAGQPSGRPEGLQVALSSSALRSSVSDQMRGSSAPAALEQAAAPSPVAPAVSSATTPSSATLQPQRTPAPSGSPVRPNATLRESATQAPAARIADAGAVDLPSIDAPTPALGLPQSAAAEPPASAEAGIDAPALASVSAPARADAAEVGSGSAAVAVELGAASTPIADGSTFSPAATVGDAAPASASPALDALDALGGSLDLPAPQAPGLALAMPTTGAADAAPAEAEASSLTMAPASSRAVPAPVAGDIAAPIADLDAHAAALSIADADLGYEPTDARAASDLPEPTLTLDLAPPTLAMPQLALPEAVLHRFELLGMVIDDRTEEPLAGAQIRLDLEGAADLTDATADDGTFALGFDEIPDNAALTATLEGYTPGAINIAHRDLRAGRRAVVRLRKIDPYVIVVEPEPAVHHLGNDEFSGRINSQFQRGSEGLVLRLPFEMTQDHANLPLRGAELRLLVKGTQAPNPVRLNGRQIATLAQSPSSGAFGEQIITIPSGVLRLGRNVLELESIARPGSDKDDYEFVNPRVVLLVDETEPPI